MNSKDYMVIAGIFSRVRKINWVVENEQANTGVDVCDKLADELASGFARCYPKFRRDLFLRACGIER